MLIKKVLKKTLSVEKIKDIKCDCCRQYILKKAQPDDFISHSSLLFSVSTRQEFEDGDISDSVIKESTDICSSCYKEVLAFIKSKGGKAPSFFRDDSNQLFGDDEVEVDDFDA